MVTCKIQWIDSVGTPTPDTNPAVGYVQCEAYREPYPTALNGFIDHAETEWFPICEAHKARLDERGMHHWRFKPVERTPIQRAAQTALDVQNACNLSGVLASWLQARDAVNAACDGTDARNHHPIHVLFANKVAEMTGQFCEDTGPYARAYDACATLAAGTNE